MNDEKETQQFRMAKDGVASSELGTAVWADLLTTASKRMARMDADAFDIEFDVTISAGKERD